MITDNDVQKLIAAMKKVFVTKDDAKNFLTKDDAKTIFQSKVDAQAQHDAVIIKLNAVEKHIEAVDKGLETLNESLVPILGNIHEWTDEIHNEVVRERLLKRVKRLEKHLGLPSLAD